MCAPVPLRLFEINPQHDAGGHRTYMVDEVQEVSVSEIDRVKTVECVDTTFPSKRHCRATSPRSKVDEREDPSQAHVETLDMLEFAKVRFSLFLDPWKSLSDVESIFEKQHKSPVINDAKSVYDALEKTESSTRNLAQRRTAVEVTAIRQRLEHGFIYTSWVNSDGQIADGLAKPQTALKLLEIMSAGRWKIVWDATFQKARKIKLAERSEGRRDFDG